MHSDPQRSDLARYPRQIRRLLAMSRHTLILVTLTAVSLLAPCRADDYSSDAIVQFWPCNWITCPGAAPRAPGVYHYRKRIHLDGQPHSFVVHVSADNRFILYVNGRRAGSAWCPPYEVNVTGLLKPGSNRLRIEVANLAINHMAGRALPDYTLLNLRYGTRFEPQDMDKVQPVPAGLFGPIRLVASPAATPAR